jgi:hypothetical protein
VLPYALAVLLAQFGFSPVERVTPAPTPVPVSCDGAADPAIESVSSDRAAEHAGTTGELAHYLIHVNVLNRGSGPQRPTTRAYVVIYHDNERIGRQRIPPLDPGVAFAFTTHFERSAEAGDRTTTLTFRYTVAGRTTAGKDDCKLGNDTSTLVL